MKRKKHPGGRPPKAYKTETKIGATNTFVDWVFSQKKSPKQPAWEVLEAIKKEVEHYRKNWQALKQDNVDKYLANERLLKISHKQSTDLGILEEQFVTKIPMKPIEIKLK